MAGFQSAMYASAEWQRLNAEALALLRQVGAVFPDDFHSTGVPQIFLHDMTQPHGEPFCVDPFKGRLVFGRRTGFNSCDVSPFPHGPVRLTLIKWGAAPEQCGKITVGDGSGLNGVAIVSYVAVTIGQEVLFGPNVVIMDSDGHPADRRLPDTLEHKKMAAVVIEDHAWVGFGALIMKGVTVGHHAVVAANAVVTRSVPPHSVAAGNPARIVKTFST